MSAARPWAGLARHFWLTLLLNLRSRQAMIYGYAVPVLFLFAFGGIFRGDTPPLAHEMGQLLTITILGGACFGLPTALVAERERGVWRRYRLLPTPTAGLVVVTLIARMVIVATAVALQLVLARLALGAPWPAHPAALLAGFGLVTAAFLGLGLTIAAVAEDVPAVQALGQCLFLPMIMIGGVGVPLAALPRWAQYVSGFMPGRYAVDLLQRAFDNERSWRGANFSIGALVVIGAAAALAGATIFRCDAERDVSRRAWIPLVGAFLAWVAVGAMSVSTHHIDVVHGAAAYTEVTDAQLASIRFDDLPGDNEWVIRLAPPFPGGAKPERVAAIAQWLKTEPETRTGDVVADAWRLLNVAALADIGADLHEAEIGRAVFDELTARYRHAELRRILGWIVLHPNEGAVVTQVPALNLRRGIPAESLVRERSILYAKKFLGRLIGAIPAE